MKISIKHIILITLYFLGVNLNSQEQAVKGYVIEGGEVVFTFNKNDYSKITSDKMGSNLDFDDLEIKNVVVSGQFNNWSKKKWKMIQISNNVYQLRKKIVDFNDAFSYEFKFVINNSYWVEPSKEDFNVVTAQKYGYNLRDIYNLKMYLAYPSAAGNVCFKLKGFEESKEVIVAGSFNKWDEDLFKMNKVDGGWELKLKVIPGVYEYRFIVDGKWMEDPNNISKVRNEFGEHNSVLDIKEYTTFKLRGYTSANNVVLSGSFNDWNEYNYSMEKKDYGWKYVIPLSGGKHHYKFIVDGEWITDPSNSVKEYDDDGNINSVYMVK